MKVICIIKFRRCHSLIGDFNKPILTKDIVKQYHYFYQSVYGLLELFFSCSFHGCNEMYVFQCSDYNNVNVTSKAPTTIKATNDLV